MHCSIIENSMQTEEYRNVNVEFDAYRHDTAISTRVVGEAKVPGLNSVVVAISCKQHIHCFMQSLQRI